MKLLNPNKAQILLLFTRNPNIKLVNKELEYYISDDNKLIGFVSQDRIDETFHALLFDRDSQMKYCMVSSELDLDTIDEARAALNRQMSQYVRDEESLKRDKPCNDFFSIVTKPEQLHPFFRMLLEPEGFFTAARSVIEELSYHFEDRDGNFVDQLQSKNGFDARIWELYLWCYLREENFNFSYSYDAPDFLVNKMGQEVAIEAVHINRKKDEAEASRIPTEAEILEKLKNEIPLLFGSPLYSKLKHTYENQPYWDLPQVKGKPLVYAIADFHADMSMVWSFPAIISILYGIDQKAIHNPDGSITLQNESGIEFQKGERIQIKPLFLDDQFKYVSAVLFSPCGTLPKFNRMGVQAGFDHKNYQLFQVKMCYNPAPNAIYPNVSGNIITENNHETWADGIQIFHNPFAEIPLDPTLFPRAGHNFYKDGIMRSVMPDNQLISTMTYNLKNFPSMPPEYNFHSNTAFNDFEMKWRMGSM